MDQGQILFLLIRRSKPCNITLNYSGFDSMSPLNGKDVIPESVQIPPLLIQPFLENAIEHGLQHKKIPGTLYLRIEREDVGLKIEIEDDGIGRKKSLEMKKRKAKLHKSLGMSIVQSRIQSLNRLTGKNIMLEIEDLKDDQQKGVGTLVRIIISD